MDRTIGILETGRPPAEMVGTHGSYPDLFAALLAGRGFAFRTWAVLDGQIPEQVTEADGWLITGSRHGAYEPHDWIPPLEAFIRDAIAASHPLVGICFGHQIMTQALGGEVRKFPDGWGLGAEVYDIDGLGAVSLNAVHQDQVLSLPPGAVSEGRSAFCAHAAIRYGPNAWSVQPHPEMGAAFLADLLEARRDVFPAPAIRRAKQTLSTPLDQHILADKIADILRGSSA